MTTTILARMHRAEQDLRPFGDTTGVRGARPLQERMDLYGVSGLSLAVIEDGALAWVQGYGTRALDDPTPISAATRYPAASLSKPVVAMAVLRLVQEGVLDLDTDVNQYLTSWQLPDNRFTQQRKVTLRGLLSHTAGITLFGFWGYRPGTAVPTLHQILDGLPPSNAVPVRVDTVPGTRWRYSGGGYTIVQQLLMDVLGRPFPDLMHTLVLAPLGLTASAFSPAPPAELAALCAVGHDATGVPLPGRWRTHPELAAGGLWSTPTDLARFLIAVQDAYQGRAERVLARSTAEAMLTVQHGNWALGPAIDGAGAVARLAHGGATLGFRCYMVAYQTRGQGAVVMTNGDRGDHLCVEVLHSVARAFGWPAYAHYLDAAV